MKRISTPLEPTPFNPLADNLTALTLAIYGSCGKYFNLDPISAAKTVEICKTLKETTETSDQALTFWKWHVCHLYDVKENLYDSTAKGVWRDLFIAKSKEIQNIAVKCQNNLKIEEYLRNPGNFNFKMYNFLEIEKQEILSSILPFRIYLSKPNANAKIQYFLYKYLQREASIEAFNFCKLAADQGHDAALFEVAECYEQGRLFGLAKNLKEAVNYYTQGANKGNYHALYKIGEFHENGNFEGIEKNMSEAFKIYKKAAGNGNCNAQVKVAEFYFSAMKIDREKPLKYLRKAFEYYKLAADQGAKNAKYAIAQTLYPLCLDALPDTYEASIKPLQDFLAKPNQ